MLQDRDLKQLLHIKQDVAKHKWSQHISKQSRLNWKSIVYNVHVEPVWAFTCGSIKQSTARQPQVTRELLVKKIELISNVSGPDSANDSSQNPYYKPNVCRSGAFDSICTKLKYYCIQGWNADEIAHVSEWCSSTLLYLELHTFCESFNLYFWFFFFYHLWW